MYFLTGLKIRSLRPKYRYGQSLVNFSSRFANNHPLTVFPHSLFPVCGKGGGISGSSLYISTNLIGSRPIFMVLSNLNYFLRGPNTNKPHWGLGFQHINLRRVQTFSRNKRLTIFHILYSIILFFSSKLNFDA